MYIACLHSCAVLPVFVRRCWTSCSRTASRMPAWQRWGRMTSCGCWPVSMLPASISPELWRHAGHVCNMSANGASQPAACFYTWQPLKFREDWATSVDCGVVRRPGGYSPPGPPVVAVHGTHVATHRCQKNCTLATRRSASAHGHAPALHADLGRLAALLSALADVPKLQSHSSMLLTSQTQCRSRAPGRFQ